MIFFYKIEGQFSKSKIFFLFTWGGGGRLGAGVSDFFFFKNPNLKYFFFVFWRGGVV